jgi:hypothetical protein
MAKEFNYCLAYKLSSLEGGIQTCMREKACNVLNHAGEDYLAVTFMACDAASLDLMRSAMGEDMKSHGALVFNLRENEAAASREIHDLRFKDRFLIAGVLTLDEFEAMCLPTEDLSES